MMGVQPGKYRTFGEFNMHVIKPAVAEINALAPFGITVMPVRKGKRSSKSRSAGGRKTAPQPAGRLHGTQ